MALNLFDPQSRIFVKSLQYLLISLGVLVILGLMWEYVRRRRFKKKIGVIGKHHLMKRTGKEKGNEGAKEQEGRQEGSKEGMKNEGRKAKCLGSYQLIDCCLRFLFQIGLQPE